MLGFAINERTVSRYLKRLNRTTPITSSQTWKTFLRNHAKTLVSVDFFVVPTLTFRLLYVLVVLSHDRRRVLFFNVTSNPTPEWTAHPARSSDPSPSIP